jgi:hypothetical protein
MFSTLCFVGEADLEWDTRQREMVRKRVQYIGINDGHVSLTALLIFTLPKFWPSSNKSFVHLTSPRFSTQRNPKQTSSIN